MEFLCVGICCRYSDGVAMVMVDWIYGYIDCICLRMVWLGVALVIGEL